jgi:hypothetical protein
LTKEKKMSGIRTAVAVLTATVVAGGALAGAAQQPARASAPAPAQGRASGAAAAPGPSPQSGTGQTPSPLPLSQTVRDRGTSVTGSFEGWYHGKDGNDYASLGYFNRNTKQELDIPVGPNNRIEPGGPDLGQPTHFLTGRQRGVFALKLPKDLGTKKLVWTIVSNGFTNAITVQTYPTYIIEPYMNSTTMAVPPVLKFDPNGPSFVGPPQGFAATYTASVGSPLTLTTYVTGLQQGRGGPGGGAPGGGAAAPGGGRGGRGAAPGNGAAAAPAAEPAAGAPAGAPAPDADAQAPPQGRGGGRGGRGAAAGGRGAAGAAGAAAAGGPGGAGGFGGRGGAGGPVWTKYRGPGAVTFAAVPRPAGEPAPTDGKAQTTALFDAPGDYVIRVQVGNTNGEQCCWTNAHVKVTVK